MTDTTQNLMNAAYDRYTDGMSKEDFMDQLSAAETIAVSVGNMNCQVENGGFSQWFYNGYGTSERVAFLIRLADRIDTDAAKQVRRILVNLASSQQSDQSGQSDVFGYDDEEEEDDFDDMNDWADTDYYAVNDAWLADVEAYLQKLEA